MQVKVLMVAVFEIENHQEIDGVINHFQEEVETKLCHKMNRARLADLDEFQPDNMGSPDLYVSHLDCE